MKKVFTILLLSIIVVSCKSKKKKHAPDVQFFPVVTFLKGQVAQIDTSIASIRKIEKLDTIADTVYIKRDDFSTYAQEFLQLPDVSSDALKEKYDVTHMYDDLLNAFVFTYTTKDEEQPIKKQDVIIEPGEEGEDKIKAINIDKWEITPDSTIQKTMLWETDKRFLIITKVEKKNQQEKVRVLEVIWNNF